MLLLTIFVTYLSSNYLFVHYHNFNGKTIVHSHIYCGTPNKPGHNHTPSQFNFIAMLSEFFALKASLTNKRLIPIFILCSVVVPTTIYARSAAVINTSLRAPPML